MSVACRLPALAGFGAGMDCGRRGRGVRQEAVIEFVDDPAKPGVGGRDVEGSAGHEVNRTGLPEGTD